MPPNLKTSLISRSAQLFGVAAQLAKSEMGQKIRNQVWNKAQDIAPDVLKTRIAQAKLLTENLAQLKGAAMKAGQLLSLDSNDILPPEVQEILAQLQKDAPPLSFEEVAPTLQSDLGDRLSELEGLNRVAAAAASIGQVHRATYQGTPVAVKVQYPNIADSIDSDLKLLSKIVRSFLVLSGRNIEVEPVFEELGRVLHQEADYEQEAKSLMDFKSEVEKRGLKGYKVPKVFESMSSPRVLTMEWMEGQSLEEWIRTNPDLSKREAMAKRLLDLYCFEFFELGSVQTDPNLANFLVQSSTEAPDGFDLVLLDFGASLSYDDHFRKMYHSLLETMSSKDPDAIIKKAIEVKMFDPRESKEAREAFVELVFAAVEPFFPAKQPFHFRDDEYQKRARAIGIKVSQNIKYSPPPKELIFLHRKLGGLMQMCRRLDVALDLTPYWLQMVGKPL